MFLIIFAFSDRILCVLESDLTSLSQGWYYTLVPYFISYFEMDSSILLPQPPGSRNNRLAPLHPASCIRLSALPRPCFWQSVNSEGMKDQMHLLRTLGSDRPVPMVKREMCWDPNGFLCDSGELVGIVASLAAGSGSAMGSTG